VRLDAGSEEIEALLEGALGLVRCCEMRRCRDHVRKLVGGEGLELEACLERAVPACFLG
jgi:hypothetical protein